MAKEKFTEMTKEQAAQELMSEQEMDIMKEFKDSLAELSAKELVEMQDDLSNQAGELGNKLAAMKYPVKFGKDKLVVNIMKYLEKNAKWKHQDVPMLISCYLSLKDIKENGLDDDGMGEMGQNDLNTLYQTFLKGEGTGYFEARKHLTLITEIGQPVTDAMQVLGKNNEELRDIHTKLSIIDAEVNVRQSADAQGASVDKGSAEVVTEEVDNSAE
tara:strand:+ start:6353 stop:6997 length:645 start_codon:yes stop_codon:yes gene_type:complete